MNTMPQHCDSCIWSQGGPEVQFHPEKRKKKKEAWASKSSDGTRPASSSTCVFGALDGSCGGQSAHRTLAPSWRQLVSEARRWRAHTCLLRVWRAIVFKDTLTSAALYFVPVPYHHPTRHPQDAGEWFARVGRRNTGGVCWWGTQSASVGFIYLFFLCLHRCRWRVDNFILINCHVEKYARKQTEKNRRSYCCLFLFVFI